MPLFTALLETNYNEYLTNNDWNITCEILKLFKEIAVEISLERFVTISKIVVLSKQFIKYYNKIKLKPHKSIEISNMVDVLIKDVDKKFGTKENSIIRRGYNIGPEG